MFTTVDEKKIKSDNPGIEVYVLESESAQIAVRIPTDAEWGSFLDEREKTGARSLRNLVRTCLVAPSDSDFRALLNKKPGLSNVFGNQLLELAGLNETASVKKA